MTLNHAGVSSDEPLSIIVLGASGDLALKKILPALFTLHSQDFLPKRFCIFGFARSNYTDAEFREQLAKHLQRKDLPQEQSDGKIKEFLSRCFFVQGNYDSADSYLSLYEKLREQEGNGKANRIYYMAIPPFLFLGVAAALGNAGLVACGVKDAGWSRAVIEKPFGRDRESSDVLVSSMDQIFTEEQTFRIDHYLGKEVIQNLLVLRFANRIFEPIWNRRHIHSVQVSFMEDFGVEDRAGYFDQYGIIRDVMQNHLLEMVALTAMESPRDLQSTNIRNEKVNLLRLIKPVMLDDMVLGQYEGDPGKGKPGYLEEKGMPKDSITATYASAILQIQNDRWAGVPFLLTAGKALDKRMTEIRIQFRPLAANIFSRIMETLPTNELVIRVQPDEAIYFQIVSKVPGLDLSLAARDLDMRYKEAFERQPVPEAYERLFLDVLQGDKSLFIRADELRAAWDIFTPALHKIDEMKIKPEKYVYGSSGPAGTAKLAAQYEIHLP